MGINKNAFSKARKQATKARKARFQDAPVGTHICKIVGYTKGTGKKGTYVSVTFLIVDGEFSGRKFSKYFEISEERLSFLLEFLATAGFEMDDFKSEKSVYKALDELVGDKPLAKVRVSEKDDFVNVYCNKIFTDEEAEDLDIDGEDVDTDDEDEDEDESEDDDSDDEDDDNDDEDDSDYAPAKGDRVEVELGDGEKYPGKVTRSSKAKELCSVEFDDGDKEAGLAWADIALLDADDDDEDESDESDEDDTDDNDDEDELDISKGMTVSFKKGRKKFVGKVIKLNEDEGTVSIKDDDGKTHKNIDHAILELVD
ncbi:hypothetical protein LCGC14_0392210 [marine sediment metagenome]|uniref:Uncharacterized protein n=1 Tax=marine sediment metagenome TaxID=412755 RepID=A0A0F9THC3_9ZZZZ